MPTSDDHDVQRLAHETNEAMLGMAPTFEPLMSIQAKKNHHDSLKRLSTACLGNSQSVLYLVGGLRLWDAEIVLRSVFEGTIKFAYLLESPATFEERCREYSEVLPTISKLRWHMKSDEALEALGGQGEPLYQPFREILLPEAEIEAIRKQYPREVRQRVEARWGFTALVAALSRPGGAFGGVGRAALHSYMVSSHLIHMTDEGVWMPYERDVRKQARRDAVTLGHASRLMSDCLELTFLRAISIRRFLGTSPKDLFEIRSRHEKLFDNLHKAGEQFTELEYGKKQETKGDPAPL
ncbi:hypothetical protein ACVWZZ_003343 [Bradyrhizobium sp. LM6.10]|jgi:hypothetical protein